MVTFLMSGSIVNNRLILARFTVVWAVIVGLSGCSTSGPPVADGKSVEHWLEAIEDKDPKVREKAVEKLGNIGAKSKDAIEAVVTALDDADPKVRRKAIMAVVRNRSAWAEGISKLEEMSESDASEANKALAAEAVQNLTK